MKCWQTIRSYAFVTRRVIIILSVIGVWHCLTFIFGDQQFPSLLHIGQLGLQSLSNNSIIDVHTGSGGFLPHIKVTALRFVIGFLSGWILGIIISLMLFRTEISRNILNPILESIRVFPPLILIPFVLIFWGPTLMFHIIVPGIYALCFTIVYGANALQNIRKTHLQTNYLLNASWIYSIIQVELPAIWSEVVGAAKIIAPLSFGILIVSEYLAASVGLGRTIKLAVMYSRVDLIFVAIIWSICIVVVNDMWLSYISKKTLRWML